MGWSAGGGGLWCQALQQGACRRRKGRVEHCKLVGDASRRTERRPKVCGTTHTHSRQPADCVAMAGHAWQGAAGVGWQRLKARGGAKQPGTEPRKRASACRPFSWKAPNHVLHRARRPHTRFSPPAASNALSSTQRPGPRRECSPGSSTVSSTQGPSSSGRKSRLE